MGRQEVRVLGRQLADLVEARQLLRGERQVDGGEVVLELKAIDYDPARPIEAQLAEFVEAKRAVAANPAWLGLMKVAITVFIANPDVARETLARLAEEEARLVVWLRAATADGRLRVEDPERAAQIFCSMVSGGFYWPSLYLGRWRTPRR